MANRRAINFATLALLCCVVSIAQACSVPVFQMALTQWPVAPYRVFIYHRGALTAEQQIGLKMLADFSQNSKDTPANLIVTDVDLETEKRKDLLELSSANKEVPLPATIVLYPEPIRIGFPRTIKPLTQEQIAYKGKLEPQTVAQLVDSPARHEITEKLKTGNAAVWVFVESGQADADGLALAKLSEIIAAKAKVAQENIEKANAEHAPRNPAAPKNIPIMFAIVRVSPQNPAEALFLAMLGGIEEEPLPKDQPVIFPVFGRGRALARIAGRDLNPQTLASPCDLILGDCSCIYRLQPPGSDLLLRTNWDDQNDVQPPAIPATKTAPPAPDSKPDGNAVK